MSKVVEKYVIKLENEKFAEFDQESVDDIFVNDLEDFTKADFLDEKDAKDVFDSMKNGGIWNYYGDCIKPLRIVRVLISLESK